MELKKIFAEKSQNVNAPRDLTGLERALRGGCEHITITAAVAAAVLEQWNHGNRRRDELTVHKYRRAMDRDGWQSGHEIGFGVFADDVQLGNGQHRMAAQVASGTSQSYRVTIHTDTDAYALYVSTCDEGRVRSLSDMLQIFAIQDGSGAAKLYENTVNAMHAFHGGKPTRMDKVERLEFAKGFIKPIRYVIRLPGRTYKAHVLGAIALAHAKKPAIVEGVIAAAIGGANLDAGSPAHAMDRSRAHLNDARSWADKERKMALVLRAMHDAARGRAKTSILKVDASGGPVCEAVEFFCGVAVATAYAEHQEARDAQ